MRAKGASCELLVTLTLLFKSYRGHHPSSAFRVQLQDLYSDAGAGWLLLGDPSNLKAPKGFNGPIAPK